MLDEAKNSTTKKTSIKSGKNLLKALCGKVIENTDQWLPCRGSWKWIVRKCSKAVRAIWLYPKSAGCLNRISGFDDSSWHLEFSGVGWEQYSSTRYKRLQNYQWKTDSKTSFERLHVQLVRDVTSRSSWCRYFTRHVLLSLTRTFRFGHIPIPHGNHACVSDIEICLWRRWRFVNSELCVLLTQKFSRINRIFIFDLYWAKYQKMCKMYRIRKRNVLPVSIMGRLLIKWSLFR